MKRKNLTYLAATALLLIATTRLHAQVQTTGTPGTPGSTTTISGKQLPAPPQSTGFGVITELSTGYPGYNSIMGAENGTIGQILKGNGYATSWIGKDHNTPDYTMSLAGPFDQWPSGMGFDYFYGFLGGETDQWTPYLFQDHTQIFPWIGKPGYILITDMSA